VSYETLHYVSIVFECIYRCGTFMVSHRYDVTKFATLAPDFFNYARWSLILLSISSNDGTNLK